MATTELTEALRRRSRTRRPTAAEAGPRHPAVALAMALPCAAVLLVLFGGWHQLAAQATAVANLLGR